MTYNSTPSIQINVLLFAAYREAVGQQRTVLHVPAGTTVSDLYSLLARDTPRLRDLRPYTTFAVNREVCSPNHILVDNDEVAFLQPASGGSHD